MNTLITSGQKEQIIRVVVDAVRKGMDAVVDELSASGTIDTAKLQRALGQGGVLASHLIAEVKAEIISLAELAVGFLIPISGDTEIIIGETDGTGMIAGASDVFPGWIDPDFVNYRTNVKGMPTRKAKAQVFEIIKDGTFAQIFGGFGKNLDRLCWEQDQIKLFVRDHSKWISADDFGTFFLFRVNGEFFVAYVDRGRGGLQASLRRRSLGCVWRGRNRLRVVVPPQL